MYAAGRIPGSFFRREGRPVRGRHPHLPPDRPSAAPDLQEGSAQRGPGRHHGDGARPRHPVRRPRDQRRVDVHSALRPAVLRPGRRRARRPHRRPVGRLPDATASSRTPSSTWSSRVACTETGDVAIMMVEAESTESTWDLVRSGKQAPTEEVVAGGLDAAKPFIKQLCDAQSELAKQAAKPVAEFPVFLDYRGRRVRSGRERCQHRAGPGADHRGQAGAREQDGRGQGLGHREGRRGLRGPREGARCCLPCPDQEARARPGAARQGPHRRPWAHRHPDAVRRDRRHPAGARLGAVRAWRDPDPGRHHPQHADAGAEARHALPGDHASLHAQLQLPAVLHR